MDDMGMTFHVISDLKGEVQHKDRIARRLLQLDRVNFPAGILFDGHYENHLNWDAVKIFRSAWPNLDDATRETGAWRDFSHAQMVPNQVLPARRFV